MLLLHKNIDITSVGIFFFGFLNINNYFCKKKKIYNPFYWANLEKKCGIFVLSSKQTKKSCWKLDFWGVILSFYLYI